MKFEFKSKQETFKGKEIASILAQIHLNNIDLHKINKKNGYKEKTFVNTGLLPNFSLNINSIDSKIYFYVWIWIPKK